MSNGEQANRQQGGDERVKDRTRKHAKNQVEGYLFLPRLRPRSQLRRGCRYCDFLRRYDRRDSAFRHRRNGMAWPAREIYKMKTYGRVEEEMKRK